MVELSIILIISNHLSKSISTYSLITAFFNIHSTIMESTMESIMESIMESTMESIMESIIII